MDINVGEVELGQGIDDAHGFDADMDNPLDGGYQILRVFEPGVGIVDDAALLVLYDAVTVDEPLQRCFPVDLIAMRGSGNALQAHVLVDAKGGFFVVEETHFLVTDAKMLRSCLSTVRALDCQRVFLTGFVTEVEGGQIMPGLGKRMKIRCEWNAW